MVENKFIEMMCNELNIELHKYQKDWLKEILKNKVVLKI